MNTIEAMLAKNKYRAAAVAVVSGSLALSMHFFEMGIRASRRVK